MDRSFEYKIQLSVGANDFSPDIEKILKNAQIKADKNAVRVTITGNQEDFIKQLLDLKKQMPNLDLTDGIEIHLADELLEQTDAGKKALSDLATVLANSLQEMSADIKNVDEMIGNVQKKISDLEKRKLQLFNNKDIKDASSAFDAAEKRFQDAATKFNNTTGKVQQNNLEKMRAAYQDMVNFEGEANKSAAAVLNRIQQNIGKNVEKEISQGYQSLVDIKPTSTYTEAVKAINDQLVEQQGILQRLNARKDELLNPTVAVKGKLVDTFKQDIQSQIDELGTIEVKVKPKVDGETKVEVETAVDEKPTKILKQDTDEIVSDAETAVKNFERLSDRVKKYQEAKADKRLANPSIVDRRKGRGFENISELVPAYPEDVRNNSTTKTGIKRKLDEYLKQKKELETGVTEYGSKALATEKTLSRALDELAAYTYSFRDAEEAAEIFGKKNKDVFDLVQERIELAKKASKANTEAGWYKDFIIHDSLRDDYGVGKITIGETDQLMNAIESNGLEGFAAKVEELFGVKIPTSIEEAKASIQSANEVITTPHNTSAMDTVEEELREEAQAHHENEEAAKADAKAQEEFNNSQHGNQNGLLSDTTTPSAIDEITQAENRMGNEAQEVTQDLVLFDSEIEETTTDVIGLVEALDKFHSEAHDLKNIASLGEMGIFTNSKTGYTSPIMMGDFAVEGLSEELYNTVLENVSEEVDTFIHSHPNAIAAFSEQDILAGLQGNMSQLGVFGIDEVSFLDVEKIRTQLEQYGIEIEDFVHKMHVFILDLQEEMYESYDDIDASSPKYQNLIKEALVKTLDSFSWQGLSSNLYKTSSYEDYYNSLINGTSMRTAKQSIGDWREKLVLEEQLEQGKNIENIPEAKNINAVTQALQDYNRQLYQIESGENFEIDEDELEAYKNKLLGIVPILEKILGINQEVELEIDTSNETPVSNESTEAETKALLSKTNSKSQLEKEAEVKRDDTLEFETAINEYVDDLIAVESQADKTSQAIDNLWNSDSDSSVDFLAKELHEVEVEANPILDLIKNEADEADDAVEELSRDIDNLGNTPNPTDNAFENTIISYKKALDKLSDTLPSDYSGEVRNQLNSLYDELNVMTEDDDLTEWGSKYRVVADNVRLVNDEVKNLGKNLTMSKADYSLSLDKSLKINELNKYRDELRELGLESDDVKSRITELYNRLGSAQDKSDLGIFSKEFKLLQQEMSDVVKGKRKDNQDASSNDIKSRNKLLSNYISKLKEQAKYEEQIKDLRTKGVDDSDNQITSRTKAIEGINNEIALMGELNLTEEENLNIQNRVAQARRQYVVNLQKDDSESDKQKEVNETKRQYVELLKRENELYLQNDLEKRTGVDITDYSKKLNEITVRKDELKKLLTLEEQQEFLKIEADKAEKARSEGIKQNAKTEEALLKRRQNLLQQITQWLKSNPIAEKKYGSGLKESIDQLNSSAKLTPKILDDIEKEFKNIKLEATKAGDLGASFGKILKQRWQSLGAYIGSFASFYQVVDYIRKMVDSVEELDSALTEMRKVSDESVSTLKAFQKESFNIADQVGSTANVIQNSTADWMRLGESLEQAKESAKDASILLNVSEFSSIDEATTALVAMSQAYKELDKMEIIDKLNNIGNNFSISTDQLASGLQNAAAVLKTQGNDIDKSIALLTAANSITQDISKASAGTRTIALRIAGTEAAKKELEELGEATDDYIVQTSSKTQETIKAFTAVASNAGRGVDVLDSNGNLRDTYDILLDISKVYKEIQEEDKKAGTNRANALVEYIAGKNRSNIAASILENPQMLEDVYKASQDSVGSAMEENAKYIDSIAGHIAQLQNQLQKLYSNTLSSDVVKGFVDFLKVIVELIDKVGVLKTAFITLGTVVGSKRLG